jgi:tetraacyldisaccharide 4'-kinase
MSRVFRALVATRARLYERGVLPVYRLNHPVVSVGNLTVGGTGKTPLVIELARRLRESGFRPVILSRGYRRESRGILVVSRGDGPEVDWTQSGDEPQLMARRLDGVSVVVGNDRYQAGLAAQRQDLGDLFLLDDGFQHRRLHRDMDIVTVDPLEWAGEERLLPEGRWREPRVAIRRADAVCVQSVPGQRDGGALAGVDIPVFGVDTVVDGLIGNDKPISVEAVAGSPVAAFAGIAKPERFFHLLESLGLPPDSRRVFPDHHAYTETDISRLPSGIRVTTEKDAVRLPPGSCCFLRVSANIRNFNQLHELILRRIQRHDDTR